MLLHYGTTTAAICSTRHKRDGEPICQSLTIDHVDRAVAETFLRVMEPAQADTPLARAKDLERNRTAVRSHASGGCAWNWRAMKQSGPSGSTTCVSRRIA